jgi:hypothetical protein
MNPIVPLSLTVSLACLSIASHAQQPPPPPPPSVAVQAAMNSGAVTRSGKIRSFDVTPDGEIRSAYLSDGAVIDFSPVLGAQVSSAIRKGERLTATGARVDVGGQTVISARSVRVGPVIFTEPAPPTLDPAATAVPPPPPPLDARGPQPRGPAPGGPGIAAAKPPVPCGVQMPPPPPPVRPDGPPVALAPPAPPPSAEGAVPPSPSGDQAPPAPGTQPTPAPQDR